jgi:hypothetical protein
LLPPKDESPLDEKSLDFASGDKDLADTKGKKSASAVKAKAEQLEDPTQVYPDPVMEERFQEGLRRLLLEKPERVNKPSVGFTLRAVLTPAERTVVSGYLNLAEFPDANRAAERATLTKEVKRIIEKDIVKKRMPQINDKLEQEGWTPKSEGIDVPTAYRRVVQRANTLTEDDHKPKEMTSQEYVVLSNWKRDARNKGAPVTTEVLKLLEKHDKTFVLPDEVKKELLGYAATAAAKVKHEEKEDRPESPGGTSTVSGAGSSSGKKPRNIFTQTRYLVMVTKENLDSIRTSYALTSEPDLPRFKYRRSQAPDGYEFANTWLIHLPSRTAHRLYRRKNSQKENKAKYIVLREPINALRQIQAGEMYPRDIFVSPDIAQRRTRSPEGTEENSEE